MIGKKMVDALNKQIQEEMKSAILYLSMSADFQVKGLPGFANWMHVQYQEEMIHAFKIYDYILAQRQRVEFRTLEAPPASWDSPLAAFEAAFKHEQYITGCIHALVKLAREENDFATETFLQWFVTEQIEEENNADTIMQQCRMIGNNSQGLYMLDKELATRVFVPPAAGPSAT